jgi:hypothetical protein
VLLDASKEQKTEVRRKSTSLGTSTRTAMWDFFKTLGLVLVLCTFARADVGLLLGESTGKGMSRWTSAGHSAVYLSRVCPETPVRMRLCAPGEQGSVLNNYVDFSEDKPYQWNIVPLSFYLFGVADAKNRPLYASPELRAVLQERYRREQLGAICPDGPCADGKANWRDTIAANFVRDVYMFEVDTSVEQDEAFIAKFNAMPNVDHYNGFTRNCADFARLVINTYFPGAARPDHLNDFWMTSPKAISKSFTHYAVKRPALNFRVVRFTQVPGSYRRSSDARKGTEVAFTSKKWFFPMLLRSNELILFTASYLATGRFNPEQEMRRRPDGEVSAALVEAKQAGEEGDAEFARDLKLLAKRQRDARLGTREEWSKYSDALTEFRNEAAERGFALDGLNAKELATAFDASGKVVIDADGAIWIDFQDGDSVRRVGVSASNVNAAQSDGELGHALLLARIGAELATSPKNRELMPEFKEDWQRLQDARNVLNWKIVARQMKLAEPSSEPTGERSLSVGNGMLP